MRSALAIICIAALVLSSGCGESSTDQASPAQTAPPTAGAGQGQAAQAETPREGAAAILMLLKNEDYKTLVQERYSEWERTRNMPESGSPEQALEKAASLFARHRDQMIEVYETLSEADFTTQENPRPQPGETDKMAVTSLTHDGKKVQAMLYLMESGRWGFHL